MSTAALRIIEQIQALPPTERAATLDAALRLREREIAPGGLKPGPPSAKPIWEIVEEIGRSVPMEEWANVPTDGARNLDHYLYGHAKAPKE
jgi:hypothetical protein